MFFILRNIPEPLYNGLVKLRMPKVLTIPLPQDLWQENQYWSSRILMSRLQADSGKSKQGTSRNISPQTNVKLNLRRDPLRADTLLGWSMTSSKFVANMEPSWTSEIHPKFHEDRPAIGEHWAKGKGKGNAKKQLRRRLHPLDHDRPMFIRRSMRIQARPEPERQREGTTSFTFSDRFTAPTFERWRKR